MEERVGPPRGNEQEITRLERRAPCRRLGESGEPRRIRCVDVHGGAVVCRVRARWLEKVERLDARGLEEQAFLVARELRIQVVTAVVVVVKPGAHAASA